MLFSGLSAEFKENIAHKIRNKIILFPEGQDARVQKAASILKENYLVDCILIDEEYGKNAQKSTLSFLQEQANKKGKELPLKIQELTADPVFAAGVLLAQGKASAVIAGCVYTTTHVLRAALATVGLKEGTQTLTSAFLMSLHSPTRGGQSLVVYSDCAVVPKPTSEQLCSIAHSAQVAFVRWTHETAYVSFLSFSTAGSAKHLQIENVQKATTQFKEQFPHILCDGEVQFDAACDPAIAQRKYPNSQVCGKTNVFIFPDLNAGNIGYKMAQQIAGAQAWGPILLGTAKPFSDLSRGASAEDIAHCAALTAALG